MVNVSILIVLIKLYCHFIPKMKLFSYNKLCVTLPLVMYDSPTPTAGQFPKHTYSYEARDDSNSETRLLKRVVPPVELVMLNNY